MESKSNARGNLEPIAFRAIFAAARLARSCDIDRKEKLIALFGCSDEVRAMLEKAFIPFHYSREFDKNDLWDIFIPMNQVLIKFISSIAYVTQKSPSPSFVDH